LHCRRAPALGFVCGLLRVHVRQCGVLDSSFFYFF
jgi:hypothetical protein